MIDQYVFGTVLELSNFALIFALVKCIPVTEYLRPPITNCGIHAILFS